MLAEKIMYDQYPEYIEPQKAEKAKKVVKKKTSALNKHMYITLAILLLITSLFILQGYAKITSVRLEITKLENNKIQLEKVRNDLSGTLEGLKNTALISEEAIKTLGMVYPEEGQVVYLTVDDTVYSQEYKVSFQDRVKSVISVFSSLF